MLNHISERNGSENMLPSSYKIKQIKINYNYPLGKQKSKGRKAFTTRTKKIEWMKAGGHKPELYIEQRKFFYTSKCRRCKRPLRWGDRSYDFDHKDNNSANNSQKNCYLVCKVCHGKATVIGKRAIHDRFTNRVIGHETIKRKVGYKKPKKKSRKKRKRKKPRNPYEFSIPTIKIPKLNIPKYKFY